MFIYSFHWLEQRLEKDVETSFQLKYSSVVEHLSFPYSRAELYIFSEFRLVSVFLIAVHLMSLQNT